jgi:hypothetical protein
MSYTPVSRVIPAIVSLGDGRQAYRNRMNGRDYPFNDSASQDSAARLFDSESIDELNAIENRLQRHLSPAEIRHGIADRPRDLSDFELEKLDREHAEMFVQRDERSHSQRMLDDLKKTEHAERVGPRRDLLEQQVAKESAEKEEAARLAAIRSAKGYDKAVECVTARIYSARYDNTVPESEYKKLVHYKKALERGVISPAGFAALDKEFCGRQAVRLQQLRNEHVRAVQAVDSRALKSFEMPDEATYRLPDGLHFSDQ